jgi:membrane-associated phospholipid phosphatase
VIDRVSALRRRRARRPRRALAALARADQAGLRFLRKRGHGRRAEAAMKALGIAGEHAVIWAAIGATAALVDGRRRARWLAAGATGPAAIGLNFVVKVAVGRERPLIVDHPRLGRAPTELSFPSAHATSSFAAAMALGRVERRARLPLLMLAGAICVGRPYLGMHYPSDVLAGAALGVVIGSLVPGLAGPPTEERMIALVIDANERARRDGAPEHAPGGVPRRA